MQLAPDDRLAGANSSPEPTKKFYASEYGDSNLKSQKTNTKLLDGDEDKVVDR